MSDHSRRPSEWSGQLAQGLIALNLGLTPVQQHQLLAYLGLLAKWNRAYNLTAVRDPGQMVARQLLDSLSVLPWLDGPRILDVGCGAGLPGLPLAIARPDLEFHLLDSNGKKTRFVTQAVAELRLGNVGVHQVRVEGFRPQYPFDVITARAFAALGDIIRWTEHLLAPGGRWLAMKAELSDGELAAVGPGYCLEQHSLSVPGEPAVRKLVVVRPQA